MAGAVAAASQECVARRRPLVRAPAKRVADVKQFNPKFEDEFVVRKDYDPDRWAVGSSEEGGIPSEGLHVERQQPGGVLLPDQPPLSCNVLLWPVLRQSVVT